VALLGTADWGAAEEPPPSPAQNALEAHVQDGPVEVLPTPVGLTLAELEQRAMVLNPTLGRARAEVDAARGNWVQAGLGPNPTVGYEGQQLGSGGLAEQHGLNFEQELVRRDKLRLSQAVAAQEIARAEHQFRAQQQRVLTDVRTSYYQVLVAQRQIDLSRKLVQIGEEGLKLAEALLRGQEVGKIDVLQAQLEVENARIQAQTALNRHQAAWQRLAAVVGDLQLQPQPLAGAVDAETHERSWQEELHHLQSTSPEVAMALSNLERSRLAVERATVEPKPNFTIGGMVNVIDNGIGGRTDGSAVLSLPLPLWNKNQGAIMQAQAQVVAAQRALEQLDLSLQNRLAPVYERYANAHQQVARYRSTILPTATESLDLTRRTYEAGEISFINLLTAQRTFAQVSFNYLESLRELRIAEAELDGLLLSNSLDFQPQ
jgi:cobalt-zinc-cadmium efflux system outer membrane protein